MSFLKIIVRSDASVESSWNRNAEATYRNMSIRDKAIFMLEQAVLISYLDKVYGIDKLPKLIQQYKKEVILKYLPDIKREYFKYDKNNRDMVLSKVYPNVTVLLNISSNKLDAEECMQVLKNYDSVCKIDESFYVPYLLFVEKTHGLRNYTESDVMNATRSFNTGVSASIPSFHVSGRYLEVSYETIFPSYSLDYTNLDKVLSLGIIPDSILAYWTGYDWTGKTISSAVGVLAAQCLEKDTNAITEGSNMLGYLAIYKSIIPLPSWMDKSNSLALSSEINTQKNRIIKFLCYLRSSYGISFDDKELLATIMNGSRVADSNLLQKFLVAKQAKDVSVEMYNVFKKSYFSNFSELDILISGRNGLKNQIGQLSNAKKTKEDDDDTDAQQEEPTDDGEEPSEEPTSKDTPDASAFDGPDAETNLEKNKDSSDEDPAAEPDDNDASNSGDLGNQPDEEPNEPDASSDADTQVKDTTHTKIKRVPALPKLDDKRGIRLSLSEGESTSTVLYREEVASYIDSLLANPPSILSVQTITAIKKLKANWLYLLSVQDVHDFLAALIRVPKTLTIKK